MLIVCDLVENQLLVSKNGNIKYVQYISTHPLYSNQIGSRLLIRNAFPQKYRILSNKYDTDEINIKIVDEDLKPLNFGNEEFSLVLTIESA